MANDDYCKLLDWCERIEEKFSNLHQKQNDLTIKLDRKIKEAENIHHEPVRISQSLPLSMI